MFSVTLSEIHGPLHFLKRYSRYLRARTNPKLSAHSPSHFLPYLDTYLLSHVASIDDQRLRGDPLRILAYEKDCSICHVLCLPKCAPRMRCRKCLRRPYSNWIFCIFDDGSYQWRVDDCLTVSRDQEQKLRERRNNQKEPTTWTKGITVYSIFRIIQPNLLCQSHNRMFAGRIARRSAESN